MTSIPDLAMHHICLLQDGEMNSLAEFNSYEDAGDHYDQFCNKHPNGWVEIVSDADFLITKAGAKLQEQPF
jgi:hypothetical protein